MVLSGARQESLCFTAERALSIKEHFSILFCWEVLPHLEAHTGCPAIGAALGRDYAIGLESLATEGVAAFGNELGVGQHVADGCMLMRFGQPKQAAWRSRSMAPDESIGTVCSAAPDEL